MLKLGILKGYIAIEPNFTTLYFGVVICGKFHYKISSLTLTCQESIGLWVKKRKRDSEGLAWRYIMRIFKTGLPPLIVAVLVLFPIFRCTGNEGDRLVLGVSLDPLSALCFIAEEKGYFAGQGLDMQIKRYWSGKLALNGLYSGEADVVTVSEIPIVLGSSTHPDMRIFATIGRYDSEGAIIARRDKGIASAQDLRGKAIAVQKDSAMHYFLYLFLLKNGISQKDVTLAFEDPDGTMDALADGRIDALAMREPFLSKAGESLGDNLAVLKEPYLYTRMHELVTTDEFLKDKEGATLKLLRALLKAEEYTKKNKSDSIAIIAKHLEIPQKPVADGWDTMWLRLSLTQRLLLAMEDETFWAIKGRLVEASNIPDYLPMFSPGLLKTLKPFAITIVK